MEPGAAAVESEIPAEVPAVEPETPVEAPPEEAPAAEPVEEETPAEKPAEAEDRKRRGGFQRKIERLEREVAARDALLALHGKPQQASDPSKQTDEERATAYIAAQVQQQLEAREREREAAAVRSEFARRLDAAKAVHADFDDVVLAADAPVSPAVQEALLTSEHGPEIMYLLATNGELARLNALSPVAAAREIGRMEAKFAAVPASRTPVVSHRKPAAPAPIAPVSARGPTTAKPASQMSQDEYNAWRNSGGGR